MIITYMRSSSYGRHEYCPLSYYLEYCLGFKPKTNQKAIMGTVLHKIGQLLAHQSKALYEGKSTFIDEELGEFNLSDVSLNLYLNLAYDYYTKIHTEHVWDNTHKETIRGWVWRIVHDYNGEMNPLNKKVIATEQYFDLEINQPWASYDYGNGISGVLRIKGTIDFFYEDLTNPGVLCILDYKSGERNDWNANPIRKKEWADFEKDFQLLLYAYAGRRLFPQYKDVSITIYYVRDGGPFTVIYNDEKEALLLEKLREKFLWIKNTKVPKDIWFQKVKCSKLCSWSKPDENNVPICRQIRSEILELGIDRVTKLRGIKGGFNEYGEGGPRKLANVNQTAAAEDNPKES